MSLPSSPSRILVALFVYCYITPPEDISSKLVSSSPASKMPDIIYTLRTTANEGELFHMKAGPTIKLGHIYAISALILVILQMPCPFVQSLQLPRQHQNEQQQQQQPMQQDDPESICLSCIRSVTSVGVEPNKRCEGGYYCGPFQFSYQYWAESGKPGNSQGIRDFEKCARDKQCAEQTVRTYFKRFKRDCNNDGVVDCLDMAALHKGGLSGCSSDWFYKSRYWSAFNKTSCAVRRATPTSSQLGRADLFSKQPNHRQAVIMKNQTLTSECLDCICDGLSSCSSASTNNCGSGLVCGPFAISQAYWKDGRRPGASWTACARTKECSSVTIKNYMDKYKRDCNGDGYITCEDYAAIHRRGPMSCTNRDLLKEQYWTRFLACRANQKPSNDANLVKVNEDPPEQINLASHGDPSSSPTENVAPLTTQPARSSIINTSFQTLSSTLTTISTTTTTTTTTSTTTTTTPSPQPTAKYHPMQPDGDEQAPSSRPSVPEQSPIYELNPVLLETKATGNQVRTYQNAGPTYQAHDRGEHVLVATPQHENIYDATPHEPPHDSSESGQTRNNAQAPSTQSTEYFRPQVMQTAATHSPEPVIQRRPVIDYSSLPTIIVSKRIESHSMNRISQAPSFGLADDNSAALVVTSSMTTVPSAPSNTPIFPYHDMTQTTFSANLDPASSQQQGNQFSAPSAPIDQLNDQGLDYPLSDFAANVDRVSFDRVVNGIVASPDFSKSHPPVPEIVVQRKQPASPSSPRGPHKDATQPTTTTMTTTTTTTTTTLTTRLANENQQLSAVVANKRENSKTLSPSIYNVLDAEQQSRPEGDHSNGASLLGADSLNMTNLFDKGSNETSKIASECLDCICDASSNCDATVQCISKQREKNRCGLYMISWNQYKESDISLASLLTLSPPSSSLSNDDNDEKLYYDCATDKNCAEKLIHLYIEKYQKDCNLDGKIDCYDIAAIHRVGPDSCNSNKFLTSQYWRDFNHCYTTDRLTTTIQPQLQASQGS